MTDDTDRLMRVHLEDAIKDMEQVSTRRSLYRGTGKPAEVQAELEDQVHGPERVHPEPVQLECQGSCQPAGSVTRHWFVGRQGILAVVDAEMAWAVMYRCGDCGKWRQWGFEE